MSAELLGQSFNEGERDDEGYRTYKLISRVRTNSLLDGPATVLQCAGLPQPGATWNYGNDVDTWAWCRPTASVKICTPKEKGHEWEVTQTFSSKPLPPNQQRCNNTPIEDPLLEPQKISGSFNKYTEEASIDRFGNPIVNSAWEPITGPQAEFDANRTSIVIEQNVLDLQLAVIDALKNTVNDDTMWGVPRRCIKLSEVTFDRKFYGQCFPYYTRKFTFDVNIKKDPVTGVLSSGFDHDVSDKGTKMLYGHWDAKSGDYILDKIGGVITPDPKNPQHFVAAKSRDGTPTNVPLNGFGLPAGVNVRSGCSLYMAISGTHNKYDLGDKAKWTKLITDPTARPLWAKGAYGHGSLVNYLNGAVIQVYLNSGTDGEPQTRDEPTKPPLNPINTNPWKLIAAVTDKTNGNVNFPSYDATTTYSVGDYVSVQADVGPYFMSLVAASEHATADLLTKGKWVKLDSSPNVSPPYDAFSAQTYKVGSLVYYADPANTKTGLYVCIDAPTGQPPGTGADWILFSSITYKGNYNPTTTYNLGDYVSPGATYQGKIHVEKYDESNMFILGIPITLV